MTKFYKVTFDLYVPVGRTEMSRQLAEESFLRAMEEKYKGQRVKILNVVIVDA